MEDKEKEQLKQFITDNKLLIDQGRFEELLILACNDKNINEESLYELLKITIPNLSCNLELIQKQCIKERVDQLNNPKAIKLLSQILFVIQDL